jgi:hypothetical protein
MQGTYVDRTAHHQFLRRVALVLALIGVSAGAVVLSWPASAGQQTANVPAAAAAEPIPGEALTTFMRRVTFPEKQDCLPGTLTMALPDGKRLLTASIACGSPAVIARPITLPAGFASEPGGAFVAKVQEIGNMSTKAAQAAVSEATGLSPQVLLTRTSSNLAQTALLRHVTVVPGTAELTKTTVCVKSGTTQRCTTVKSKAGQAAVWGAAGAAIGSAGGPVGAVIGGLIGVVIGLL